MKTFYLSPLNDNELISRDSLEQISSIPYLDLYFKVELHSEYKGNFGRTERRFKYTPVDKDGNQRSIDIGNFKIIDISPETLEKAPPGEKATYMIGRDILVHDSSAKKNHSFRSYTSGRDFITKDLLPMMHTLSKTQDWDLFLKVNSIPKLELEIKKLKETIAKQMEQILHTKA